MTIRLLIVALLLGATLGCESKPGPVTPVTTSADAPLPSDDASMGAGPAAGGGPAAPAPPPP